MDKTRVILFGSIVAAAMIFGAVLGATAFASGTLTQASAALAATSPSPTPKSNESAAHEAGESAAQEAAENNGTARHGGPGGHPCGGHSNEDAAHEKAETAAQEAAENAACPTPTAATTSSP